MKILPANKSVEFNLNYNQELNCIDFNVYPFDQLTESGIIRY